MCYKRDSDASPLPVRYSRVICENTSCRYSEHPSYHLDFSDNIRPIVARRIPIEQVNFRNGIALFRDDSTVFAELHEAFSYRLLGRAKGTSFVVEEFESTLLAAGGGQTPAPEPEELPPGTWLGTAAIRTLDDENGLGDAAFTHDPENSVATLSITDITSPDASKPKGFDPISWDKLSVHHDKLSNLHPDQPIHGRVHGANHDAIVVVFDNRFRRLAGAAILLRQPDQTADTAAR